ncbi:YcxB family protein [Clostridium sp. E02]|uniref:YcxB family protein n=1 Tax=Clostridium sp. E02 TaxID=2487134 RepID=UPI000F538F22|nr:YcxB family protein [Clostridium sp. E02]
MEQKNPIVIEVKLKAKDLWKFSMYHSYRGMQGIFSLIFSAAALYALVSTWGTTTNLYRGLLFVCVLLFTVWQPALLFLKAAKQAAKPMFRNGMTLSFLAEGINVTQGDENLFIEWGNLERVLRVRDMLILYMDRVHAYLLPDSISGDHLPALTALIKENLPPERRKRI